MFYSDNPVRDFEQHDREQEKKQENLPVCDSCERPIRGDIYKIHGEILCEKCMNRKYRIDTTFEED